MMFLVYAGNPKEIETWREEAGLIADDYHVVNEPRDMEGWRKGSRLILLGTWHQRKNNYAVEVKARNYGFVLTTARRG